MIKMVKAGLGDEVVMAAIRSSAATEFDLSPDGLIALKSAGVPDTIIAAMQSGTGGQDDAAGPRASSVGPAAKSTAATIPAAASRATQVTVPAGTELKLQLAQKLESNQNKPTEVVQFSVTTDLVVDGHVVIARDAQAWGKLTKVVSQRLTRAGSMTFTIDAVKAVDNHDVTLHATQTVGGGRGLVTGNEVTVTPGTIYTATVDHDQIVSLPSAVTAASPTAITSIAPPATARDVSLPGGPAVARGPASPPPPAAGPSPSAQEAGIYVEVQEGAATRLVQLEPTVFSQGKTGGVFASAMTYGIKKMKWKAVVRGRKANLRVRGTQPVFYFYFDKSARNTGAFSGWLAAASSPNEFVLAKMDQNDSGRELTVGEFGAFGASTGARSEDTVDFKLEKLSSGVYRVTPTGPLEVGREYCLFYAAGAQALGAGAVGKLFDFGVDMR